MIVQTIDSHRFNQKAMQIRARVATILTRWELLPRFKRWRLTQDPRTGMKVLFGILNYRYIATHTSILFGDYFDPRLMHELAYELQVQVVSCNSDSLRYAFILDGGQLAKIPNYVSFPCIDNAKLLVQVIYSDNPQPVPAWPVDPASGGGEYELVPRPVGYS